MLRKDPRELAAIFAGGMLGAAARVCISRNLVSADDGWPWAIFLVNIAGAVLLAYSVTRLQERLPQSTYPAAVPRHRLLRCVHDVLNDGGRDRRAPA